MKLLIIRPEPGASASAARAKAAGFEPLLLPFFEVRARDWVLDEGAAYDALLLTSANAVRHAGAGLAALATLPSYCVGENTAAAAEAAGLHIAFAGKSDAGDAVTAAQRAGHERLLWLAGEDHRAVERPEGICIDQRIVYASEARALPPEARDHIAAADAIALHSARAARHFAGSVDRLALDRARFLIAAFSAAIAEAAGSGWRSVITADQPRDSALLSALAAHDRDTPTAKEI